MKKQNGLEDCIRGRESRKLIWEDSNVSKGAKESCQRLLDSNLYENVVEQYNVIKYNKNKQ
ncbi:MAG TPA: hypothetical protein H9723_11900 [Candidatus Mediterraneibacter stercoravium]|uniref:Uncharacterized protein n=1 Tax=Candidatus Mediterraneibacter stercoravium TaxID=2838685 RepID=A0A9D2K3N2_9FIRM|nr:hypothetical protein [Candidatus Mediterraneibacter stercoravium]